MDLELQQKIPPQLPTNERSLLEIPKLNVLLRPFSVNIDVQMLTCLLKFVDDILTTMDVEVLNSSVREIQKSENEPGSPEWKKLLGREESNERESFMLISWNHLKIRLCVGVFY